MGKKSPITAEEWLDLNQSRERLLSAIEDAERLANKYSVRMADLKVALKIIDKRMLESR